MTPLVPTNPDGCPSWDTLLGLRFDRLSGESRQALRDHLSGCPRCQRALHQFEGSAAGYDLDNLNRFIHWLGAARESPPDSAAVTALETGSPPGPAPTAASADVATPDRWVGQTVGNCVLIGLIGRGGMGVVYRARQEPLGRMVALKMILAGVHAGEQHLARFQVEGRAIARFHHPNIVQIHEFAEHDGLPYYTMELVEGGSLAARLRREALPPREAAGLVRTLALAVEEAHRKQVLHRDLKPTNILLAADGTPKIADFGLARLLDADPQTRSGAVLGTPSYMAPEQADGRVADLDVRTDVYALGAVLYECLAGQPPFRGQSVLETLEQVRSAEPLAPSRRRPGLPPGLEHICLKCLEKAPPRRYPSAQALADDLGRWLRDERPEGTPSWGQRARKGLRKHTTLVGLALVAVVLLGVWLSWPAPALERLERDLARGQAVTLIGQTGRPAWLRWRSGESTTKDSLTFDKTFTIHTTTLALVELLPDPRHDSYRFAAQVRHSRSADGGKVGLFFAHRASPGSRADIQFFTRLTFNGAVEEPGPDPGSNRPELALQFYSDEERPINIDDVHQIAVGPPFKLGAHEEAVWRDVEVLVTPDKVIAVWGGQPFERSTKRILGAITEHMPRMRLRHTGDPFLQRLQPSFAARGGLGLFVYRGSASFRSVTVTPVVVTR